MTEDEIVERESGLQKGLSKAQVVMIGLGGAIGTGLFMGSGIAINYAGPAVVLSYLIASFAAVVMVFSLSEMAVMHPTAGSFGTYAETYLNPWAGFVVRYTYWIAQVIAIGGEAVAAGVYMTYWMPDTPVWAWSLGFAFILLYVNSRSVGDFGTFEYWFAFIKVTAIVLFIILGLGTIFGIGTEPVGFHNLTDLPGGFMPNGWTGVWMGVLIGIFSFVGIEVIAVTSGETKEPEKAIPAALRTMALRLILFYLLALTIVVSFVPWTESGAEVVEQSPFVKVLSYTGIAHAAAIMNFVVISAALSSMNTNIYLCSRMLFSLSRGSYAPKFLGKLSANGTPVGAILTSGLCILLAASVSVITPRAYNYLFGIAIFGAIVVWMTILVSHISFRRRHDVSHLPVRMPFFPYLQIAGLALLAAILLTMAFDTEFWNVSWIVGVPWLILISTAYFLWKRRNRAAAESVAPDSLVS
ncbi:amino acid permease [Pelagerythrobacter aerophilus]|uniref:Amino acid permease n=1 Tax=Pelagerythrobacter aerophilus TaxID=2306995 RepID=A0A418NDR0_9SPHN|nr:amino acid permease [Pelagerythrobacter aerophilus]RIV75683.1 amino acid permease [Pelagerythrobacter aerophilus]